MRCLRERLAQASAAMQCRYREPDVVYTQRGTLAGSAWPLQWQIRLNPVLLLENQQTFIEQVVPHELAHLLVWHHYGRTPPHGKAWRAFMEEIFQLPAQRTHRFSVASVESPRFDWQCDCQIHALTLRRHNRLLRGQAVYLCRSCGGRLRAVSAAPTAQPVAASGSRIACTDDIR